MIENKLRSIRRSKGISITFMSKELGYKHPSGYANIEYGRSKPSLDIAKRIAELLDSDIETLFFSEKLPEMSNRSKKEVS